MKTNMSKIISIFLAIIMALSAMPTVVFASQAQTSSDGLFAYDTLYTDENTGKTYVEITQYLGEGSTVAVPGEIDGFEVLGLSATFSGCDFVNRVSVDEGLLYIGPESFSGNSDLSVSLPDSLKFIDESAFTQCTISDIDFGNGLKGINSMAFYLCEFKSRVQLPDSVGYLGNGAFYGCVLPFLYIGEKTAPAFELSFDYSGEVTGGSTYYFEYMGWSPFCEQYTPTDVEISEKNKSIKLFDHALYTYDSKYILAYLGVPSEDAEPVDVNILEGAQIINQSVFVPGLSIGTLKLSSTLTSINESAFSGISIQKLEFAEHSSLNTIGEYAFDSCMIGGNLVLPSSVESIGPNAFSGNDIESLAFELPSSCKTISNSAFAQCESLKQIFIPNSVRTLGSNAFKKCKSLEAVRFEDNAQIKSWNYGTFHQTNIRRFDTGKNNSVTSIDCFDSSLKLEVLDFTDCPYLESIASMEFLGNQYLKEVDLSNTNLSSISKDCFDGCSNLETVVLSDTVLSISDYAFASCTSLKSINVDNVINISEKAFSHSALNIPARSEKTAGDFKYVEIQTGIAITAYTGSDTVVSIPDTINGINVVKINNSVFRNMDIEKVTLPSSLISIGNYAFSGTTLSQMPQLPDSLESIGNYAFDIQGLSGSLIIPDSVRTIGAGAFGDCVFKQVSLGSNVGSIGRNAFQNSEMESLVIPDSVTLLDPCFTQGNNLKYIDFGCSSIHVEDVLCANTHDSFHALEQICVSENNQNYSTMEGVLYSKDGTVLIYYPQSKTDKSFTVPNGVKTVKALAFAFAGCNGLLKELIIGDSVAVLENYALALTASVEKIYISGNVRQIGYSVMQNGQSLKTVTFGDGLELSSLDLAFEDCDVLETVSFSPDSRVDSMTCTFAESGIKNAYLPNNVKTFYQTFYNTPRLESVKMPENLEYISEECFLDSGILSIEFPQKITTVLKSAFRDCNRLSEVIFNNVKGIAEYAFLNCKSLESVDLSGVTYVDELAFQGCENLKKIYFIKENGENEITANAFRGNEEIETIVVGGSVTRIDDYAFADCEKLESALISDSVTDISDNAFENCDRLKIVCLKDSYAHQYAEKNSIPCQTLSIAPIADQIYTGKEITPAVTVSAGDSTLEPNTDYQTSYADNIQVGRAMVTVLGLGDYCIFAATSRFNIVNPAEPRNPEVSDKNNSADSSDKSVENTHPVSDNQFGQNSTGSKSESSRESDSKNKKLFSKKKNSGKTNTQNPGKSDTSKKEISTNSPIINKVSDSEKSVETPESSKTEKDAQTYVQNGTDTTENDTANAEDAESDSTQKTENKTSKRSKKLTLWQRIVKFFKSIWNWLVSVFK